MMDYIIYFLCFMLSWILVHHLFSLLSRRIRNFPPGPTPLPIIGNLLSLSNKPHIALTHLSQTYGPVMCLQLGSLKTVVVSSSSSAKEVMQKNDISFSHRKIPDALQACRHNEFSMALLPPLAVWRNLRKIANSEVFSTNRLDACSHLRKEKVNDLLSQVEACCKAGMAVDIGQAVFDTTLNLLSNTFFSVDLVQQEKLGNATRRSGFKELVWQLAVESAKPNLSDFFPLVKWFDPQGIRRRVGIRLRKMLDVFDEMIDKRLEAVRGSDESKSGDALDALLRTIHENSKESFNREYLSHMLLDLFIAGTESTSSTIEWALAELLGNPTKMKKAQEELEDMIGKGNSIDESDISKLPYLQAVVKETFRLHPPVPFLIPRKAVTNVNLNGFMVPKDSQILINVWAISRDLNLWEDANSFKPERFIGSLIDVKGLDFELTPFGAGRRVCPGLPLAIRMLPMMLGSLIHSFDWRLEDGITPKSMDMEEKFGMALEKAQPLKAIPINKT